MLKILVPTILLTPTPLLIKKNTLFTLTTLYAMINALLATQLFHLPMNTGTSLINQHFFADKTSSPLIMLSYWLLPVMIMASQNHLKKEPYGRKQFFLTNMVLLQTLMAMTFFSSNTLMFYILFEATLIPTIIIITRWGNQTKRLLASTYFIYYTTVGSVPLLIAILFTTNYAHSNFLLYPMQKMSTLGHDMLWMALTLAFLVKMPLYGLHLWLPKAHVEAPIAGSMVLAAVLLKLGGYGIIRMSPLYPKNTWLFYPVVATALWGILMTGMTCLRKTDLKALIAYSSVGHMGLVVSSTLIQTPNSTPAAVLLMVAHGLTSSMLFCLTNMLYERTNTRTLLSTRGMHSITPPLTNFWLIASLTNLALPPSINFIGEIQIMTTLYNWSPITITLTATGTIISAIYSLQMFMGTQHGLLSKDSKEVYPAAERELLILALHGLPMALLTINPQLIL
uniref:NADH-ubiquinone oxidoreductase chain 4 n=1 Tax=Pseudotrapelus sinaitus TaxID=118229 RepID=D1MV83_9SAUR|nr:NADH dehydrogenase subunit 4 [Pseudotrapelus sinaitus]BAI52997.1 NADH dehydrogenase subunit 4 [Pseudotrapelus sinaitus]